MKKFKLGESHFINFEYITKNEWMYNPVAASKEFHFENQLTENYKKTNPDQIEELLIKISEALQDYKVEDVTDLNFKDFQIIKSKGDYVQEAKYNPITKKFLIFVNEKCLSHIKNFENIKFIKSRLKAFLVHEDTHKQQDFSSNGKFYDPEKYKDPDDLKAYLNQRTEIDAYARQYGFELRELYPNESTDDIFKRVFNQNIDDENLKNNLTALFDHLTIQNQRFFLRNMYDYIEGEENWE